MKGSPIASAVAPNRDHATLVWPLWLARLISLGAIYHSFTPFLTPREAELGPTRRELTGASTLGLPLAGDCSFPVAAPIDKGHARPAKTAADGDVSVLWGLIGVSLFASLAFIAAVKAGQGRAKKPSSSV
jgi:hypothetical protein